MPIIKSAITHLREHHFKEPAIIPIDVVIGVRDIATVANDTMNGKCLRLTPPELLLAYFEAIAMDLKTGDEARLQQWRSTMLCCPCMFKVCQSDDEQHKMMLHQREDMAQNYQSMRLTAVQKMYDIIALKERKERTTGKLGAEKLQMYYEEGVKFAQSSEKLTHEFIDNALTVFNRLMCIPRCKELVFQMEQLGLQNPLDSIYKLQKIVVKGGTPDRIEWAMEMIHDLHKSGGLKDDELALRKLEGKVKGCEGKGLIDELNYKRDILRYLMGDWLDSLSIPNDQKCTLRSVCSGVKNFREKCGYIYNAKFFKARTCVSYSMCFIPK